MSSFDEIVASITKKSASVEPFGKKIKLVLDDKFIVINGTTTPLAVEREDSEVDITVTGAVADFARILSKELNPQMALMTGKLKIKGDMMAAMPLMKLL